MSLSPDLRTINTKFTLLLFFRQINIFYAILRANSRKYIDAMSRIIINR